MIFRQSECEDKLSLGPGLLVAGLLDSCKARSLELEIECGRYRTVEMQGAQ